MGKLTATKIKGIKATGKLQRFYDGDYLYLFVNKGGKKIFRFKGSFLGKSVSITFGEFIDGKIGLTLSEAREKARIALADYKNGLDHAQQIKTHKRQTELSRNNTLADWAILWLDTKPDTGTKKDYQGKLNKWILPKLGNNPISEIQLADIKELYRYIEKTGSAELVKRCHSILNGIYLLAIHEEATTNNPTFGARYGITAPPKEHLPAITETKEIGKLLRDMDNYSGMASTKFAYRLIPYLMLRPGELVELKWENIDFDNTLIRIEGKDMKKGLAHIVPMPIQVVELLKLLFEYSGHGEYVLPDRQGKGHMCRDTLSKGLRKLGYQGKHTPHGFRSTASTNLYEQQHYDYAIEKQLAHTHTESNEVKASYNRDGAARYLEQRRGMLQQWADLIDKLRNDDGDPTEMTKQLEQLKDLIG